MTDKLHRIHAAPATGKGGNSFNIGAVRWRGEGGDSAEKRAQSHRIAVCWNVLEGWPTDALEMGSLRAVDNATRALIHALADNLAEMPMDVVMAVTRLRKELQMRDAKCDQTDGRLHDCAECIAQGK